MGIDLSSSTLKTAAASYKASSLEKKLAKLESVGRDLDVPDAPEMPGDSVSSSLDTVRDGAKATTNAPNTPRFITDSAGNTIDLDYTKGLRETNVTVTGTRGGVQYPLQGQTPDSYANLGNGHVVVYGPEGRALYDVSSSRIKVVEWSIFPQEGK
ncbi:MULTISPECIES: hypothetical protein [Pseudomonas]|nr:MULTISPECIES: hypothetical protein [Pseudomonas]